MLRWTAAFVWAGGIFLLSSRPAIPGPSLPLADKAFHAFEFAILTFLLARALSAASSPPAPRAWTAAILLSFIFAVSDEIHQAFVPGRTCDILDVAADLTGSFGAYLASVILGRGSRPERRSG